MKRWMVFVDGENLSMQAKKYGYNLSHTQCYWEDVFLWFPNRRPLIRDGIHGYLEPEPIRSHYYTSAAPSEKELVRQKLRYLGFDPHVFLKSTRTDKSKGLDISIAKDMLLHAFQGHYDAAVLFAGDRDYVPLIDDVKRLGKQVIVAFFEDSCHQDMTLCADHFVNLRSWLGVFPKAELPADAEQRATKPSRCTAGQSLWNATWMAEMECASCGLGIDSVALTAARATIRRHVQDCEWCRTGQRPTD